MRIAVCLRSTGAVLLVLLLSRFAIAAAAVPIRIASIFARTGPAAQSNAPSFAAVRVAVARVNARGGILGRPIRLLEFDNRSTPIGSKKAAEEAIAAGVVAIVGCAWSSHSMAVAQVAQARHIPMISTISTLPELTRVGDYIFRVCYNDLLQGRAMAHFARDHLGLTRAAILVDVSSSYSIGLARTFVNGFTALDGTVVATDHYKLRQTRFDASVRSVAAVEPDLLFVPGHDESAAIIRAAQSAGMQGIFLGGDGWDTASFFKRGGNQIRAGYFSTHWSADSDRPASRRFVISYKPNQPKVAQEALAFDAVMLLSDAIERAGSDDPRRIRDAVAATRRFDGITGSISFDASGDPVKSVVIMRIDHGQVIYEKAIAPDLPLDRN